MGGLHKSDQPLDEIGNIAEGPRLTTVSIHSERLPPQRTDDEVAHHSAVIRVHARSVGVEQSGYLDRQIVLASIIEEERLCGPLAFVVTRARSDRIHIAPVVLPLRVHGRVAVHLRGRRQEDASTCALGETQHVDRAVDCRLGRLHRVPLIVDGARWAGQVVDLIDFHIEGERDVVALQFESRVVQQ